MSSWPTAIPASSVPALAVCAILADVRVAVEFKSCSLGLDVPGSHGRATRMLDTFRPRLRARSSQGGGGAPGRALAGLRLQGIGMRLPRRLTVQQGGHSGRREPVSAWPQAARRRRNGFQARSPSRS
jgi:hypothetical protein